MRFRDVELELQSIEHGIEQALVTGDTSGVIQLMACKDALQKSVIHWLRQGVTPDQWVA